MRFRRGAYVNFHDPLGLAVRMLRSGDRAARAALVREASSLVLAPVDRCLEIAEARRLRSAPSSMLPLVLLVGGSRAGTTLIYQVLARHLPVTYFTNLSSLFPRAPLTASRLLLGNSWRPSAMFQSYYGNTTGLSDPNDGFHIWNRWLGTDRYRAPEALGEEAVANLRQFLAAWTHAFGRPLLNKNNRNADCVALLARVLPEALFVVIRRDPVSVAQSLLVARQQVQGDKRRRWGVRSLDYHVAGDPLAYVDDVCRQIVEVDRRLEEDCGRLPTSRFIEVRYERFCESPVDYVGEIGSRVALTPIDLTSARRELSLVPRLSAQPRVSQVEFERIQARLAQLSRRAE